MAQGPPFSSGYRGFVALGALTLLAAGTARGQGFKAPKAHAEHLEALAGGPVQALVGLRIELRVTPRAQKPKGDEASKPDKKGRSRPGSEHSAAHLRIDLQHPGQMRVEFRRAAQAPLESLWIVNGAKHWHGEPDGTYLEVHGAAAAEMESILALAMSLGHWDLVAPDAEIRKALGVLHSKAQLGQRTLTLQRSASAWQINAVRYRCEGRNEQLPARLIIEERSYDVLRFEPGLRFVETRFDPKQIGKAELRTVRQGAPEPNFRAPKLERQAGFSYLELPDPGAWPQRMQKVHELGLALFEAGQRPAGLPIYTSTGKLWIPFQGPAGQPAQAPKGQRREEQPAGIALVLHARGTMAEARKLLAGRLLAALRRMGRKPGGPLLLRPHVLPGDRVPEPGTEILLRAELRVRD